ncbi:MAG: hypothetical protein U9P68_12540 [Pseudomonadota bacterium]|nr:hypothetical protein [Pseudomonadota bacterium]
MRRLTILAASFAVAAPALAQETDRPAPPETELSRPDMTIDRPDARPMARQSMPEPDPMEPDFNLRDSALGQGETECTEEVSASDDEDAPSFTLRTSCPEEGLTTDSGDGPER